MWRRTRSEFLILMHVEVFSALLKLLLLDAAGSRTLKPTHQAALWTTRSLQIQSVRLLSSMALSTAVVPHCHCTHCNTWDSIYWTQCIPSQVWHAGP